MNLLIMRIQIVFDGKEEENSTFLSGTCARLHTTTDEVSWWLITQIFVFKHSNCLLFFSLSSFQLLTTWHLQSFFITWSIPDGRWVANENEDWRRAWMMRTMTWKTSSTVDYPLLSSVLVERFVCFRCCYANMQKALGLDKLLPASNYNIEEEKRTIVSDLMQSWSGV